MQVACKAMCKMLISIENGYELETMQNEVARLGEAMLAIPVRLPWTRFYKGLQVNILVHFHSHICNHSLSHQLLIIPLWWNCVKWSLAPEHIPYHSSLNGLQIYFGTKFHELNNQFHPQPTKHNILGFFFTIMVFFFFTKMGSV